MLYILYARVEVDFIVFCYMSARICCVTGGIGPSVFHVMYCVYGCMEWLHWSRYILYAQHVLCFMFSGSTLVQAVPFGATKSTLTNQICNNNNNNSYIYV